MKKSFLTITLSLLIASTITSCSNETEKEENESENTTEQVEQSEPEHVEPIEEESTLGSFESLVGEWTVDAATAGVKMNLTFNEDGSFKQIMGQVNGNGTWEVVDNEQIKIVTQNTKGQTWKITDITETSVNMCWNPDKPNPKTIPMQRVK